MGAVGFAAGATFGIGPLEGSGLMTGVAGAVEGGAVKVVAVKKRLRADRFCMERPFIEFKNYDDLVE